jgi:hypothetical protein
MKKYAAKMGDNQNELSRCRQKTGKIRTGSSAEILR